MRNQRKRLRERMKEIVREARKNASLTGKPIKEHVEDIERFERADDMLRDVNLYR